MKQNSESITTLRKYIAIGYAVIALLIGGVALIYLFEWRELERIEAESTKAFFDILNKTKKMNDSVSIWVCVENAVLLRIET